MEKGKRKGLKGLCVVLTLGILLGGCNMSQRKEDDEEQGKNAFQGEFVISAQEAVEKSQDSEVLFLDARGSKKALLGTVKGSVATTWKELSTCEEGNAGDEGWGLVPEAEDLTKRLQKLGVEKEKEIIIIGAPEDGWGEDGRILWELRQAGCTNVKIVDGGFAAMKKAGLSTKLGASKTEPSDIEVQEVDRSKDITTEELMEHYDEYKIVDTRTQEEYDGEILHDEAKGGHLPGAVLIPYVDLFREDGTLKSNQELTEMFEEKGLQKDDKIVTYCTGGIRSAYMQLVMEMCGYENTVSYGQSFWRWAKVGEVEK